MISRKSVEPHYPSHHQPISLQGQITCTSITSSDYTGPALLTRARHKSTWLANFVKNHSTSVKKMPSCDTANLTACGLSDIDSSNTVDLTDCCCVDSMNYSDDCAEVHSTMSLRVSCPICIKDYASNCGMRKHVVLMHNMRGDIYAHAVVPFNMPEELDRAHVQCRRAQWMAHGRCRINRAVVVAVAAAAAAVSDNRLSQWVGVVGLVSRVPDLGSRPSPLWPAQSQWLLL